MSVQVHDAVEAAMAAGGEKSLKEKEAEAGEGGGTKRKGGGWRCYWKLKVV